MLWVTVGIALAALVVVILMSLPGRIEAAFNEVRKEASPQLSETASDLHKRLFIADLHSDLLVWARDPLVRSPRGHTDLPRLQEGNVALQVFAAVTKMPLRENDRYSESGLDRITYLAVLQRWPVATWRRLPNRALYQARRLDKAASRSRGRLVVVRCRKDFERFLERRHRGDGVIAAVLALEGLHALGENLANLDRFFKAGFRIIGLTHFFDNAFAGSAHGVVKGGLTPLGRRAVRRMERLGVLVDLAHASPAAIDDMLAMATRPPLVSHTGVQAVCPGLRNLIDDHLRRIAELGGVIGIGFWQGAVGEPTTAAVVRSIDHAVKVAGVDHVALGSDFDGGTATPFDAAGLPRLTEALLAHGFRPDEVAKIMGEIVIRLLSCLPDL